MNQQVESHPAWKKTLQMGDYAYSEGALDAAARFYEQALNVAEKGRNLPAQREILHRIAAVDDLRPSSGVDDRTKSALDFVTRYENDITPSVCRKDDQTVNETARRF